METTQNEKIKQEIFTILRSAQYPMTITEISKRMTIEVTNQKICALIRGLYQENKVKRVEKRNIAFWVAVGAPAEEQTKPQTLLNGKPISEKRRKKFLFWG